MAAAAVPLAVPGVKEVLIAGAGGAAAIALVEAARSNAKRPSPDDSGKRSSTEAIDKLEPVSSPPTPAEASFSPKLESASVSPKLESASFVPKLESTSFVPKLETASSSQAIPELSGLRQQAARDPPVRVRVGGGGNWRIQVPFPYSIPVAAGYLLYQFFSSPAYESDIESEPERRDDSRPAVSSSATADSTVTAIPPPDNGQDSENDNKIQSKQYRKPESREMKKLLETDGKDIYENLKKKAEAEIGPGASRTVWENKNFRFDVGHLDSKNGVRHWEFQVNRNPESLSAKRILKASNKGSHQKLFKDTFDVKNPPGFEEWKKAVLGRLE